MTQVRTDLLNTRERARLLRFEPTAGITAINVQKAIEQMASAVIPVVSTVTTTPATISSSSTQIYFNVPTAVSATLPDAATWAAANPGAALFLKDISGAASTNNITINRAGSNTIDGLTSFVITSDYGFFSLRVNAGNWVFVG